MDLELLTIAEVAGLLRVSRMTVYRLIKAGKLKALRVNSAYRVEAAELQKYVSSAVSAV